MAHQRRLTASHAVAETTQALDEGLEPLPRLRRYCQILALDQANIGLGADGEKPPPRFGLRYILSVRRTEPEYDIGLVDGLLGSANALGLRTAFGFPQTRQVEQNVELAPNIERHFAHVAGCAGFIRYNGDVRPGQGVDEA
ncbi:hypothetical protein D3C71_1672960 [compost metagenome]